MKTTVRQQISKLVSSDSLSDDEEEKQDGKIREERKGGDEKETVKER